MSDNSPCDLHTEQIKNLSKRVDNMDRLTDSIHSLDKTMAIQTQMLEGIREHNAKQDARADEQQEIIIKINSNLTELNEGQKVLNKRVGKLEERVDETEDKGKIDIVNSFMKYVPYLVLLGAGYLILNISNFMK